MNNKIKNSIYHDTFPRHAFLERRFFSLPLRLVENRFIRSTASKVFSSVKVFISSLIFHYYYLTSRPECQVFFKVFFILEYDTHQMNVHLFLM